MLWNDEGSQDPVLDHALQVWRDNPVPEGPPPDVLARVLKAGNSKLDRAPVISEDTEPSVIRMQPSPRSALQWGLIAASVAAVFVVGGFLIRREGGPSSVWAQSIEAVRSKPWIHGKGKAQGREEVELWFSTEHGITAMRWGKSASFVDLRTKVNYEYKPEKQILYRLPLRGQDMSQFGAFSALFRAISAGDDKAQLPAESFQLLSQERRVDGDTKRFEHRFKCQDRSLCAEKFDMVFRGDDATRLPDSWHMELPGRGKTRRIVLDLVLDYPKAGPADAYAVGIPASAKLVDRVPADDLAQVLEGLKTGRQRFESYRGVVVESAASDHWAHSDTIYRVSRSGKRWRIEQSIDPKIQFRISQEGLQAKDADPTRWWLAKADQLHCAPLVLSDGKDSFRFMVAFKPGNEFEVTSMEKERLMGMPDDPGPKLTQPLPEYLGHPHMGFPSPDVEAKLDPKPVSGPRDTVLIDLKYTGSDPAFIRSVFAKARYWVDPRRNYLVMRREIIRTKDAVEETDGYAIAKVERSPSGYWYPTEVRRLNAIRHEDGKREDQVFRYYLDFDAVIPDSLFQAK